MSTDWAELIKDLMREHKVSERGLCTATGLNRSTIRRFLQHNSYLTIDRLDQILALFGYELDFMKVGPVAKAILPRVPAVLPTAKDNRPKVRSIIIRRKAA